MNRYRPSYTRVPNSGGCLPGVIFLVMLVIVVGVTAGCYSWSKSDCETRGGHIEFIWGDELQWQCDGATR